MNSYFKNLSGDVLVFAAMLIFGSYALFLRLLPEIPVLAFLFVMQVVGAVGFFALGFLRGFQRPNRLETMLLFLLAAVALGNDYSYWLAFRFTTIANAAVAHQMVSAFLLVFAPIFLREKTRRSEWIALAFSLVGVVILYGNGFSAHASDGWGVTLGLFSALCYALLIILYRRIPAGGLSVVTVNVWRFGFSSFVLLPLLFLSGAFSAFTPRVLAPLALFGLLFAVIASGIHNYAISKTRALHVSIIGKSEPVIAALYAFWILGETPSAHTLLGGLLIIGSSVWLAFQKEGSS